MNRGRQFYSGCATCHGPGGQGVAGLAPALVNSPWVLGPREWLGRIVLQGMTGPVEIDGEVWNGVMPPHGQQPGLDDETLAGLMIYLRRSRGHTADAVTLAQAADIRSQSVRRSSPWTVSELEAVAIDRGYGRFVGKYKVSFVSFNVFEQDGELHLKVLMYGGGPMEPLTENTFRAAAGSEDVQIEFVVEDDGAVNKLILLREGQRIPLARVED